MEIEEDQKQNGGQPDLLQLFDALPDLRILAENEARGTSDTVSARQAKLKADYMQRKVPFVCSELSQRHSSPCPECKKDFPAVEYLFFKDGAMLQIATIDGLRLHRIREHGESFPDDIKRFLLNQPIEKSTAVSRERVDRSATCPFLVRVFLKHNQGFKEEEFAVRGKEPGEERALHVWKDLTLRDITDLLKETDVTLRQFGTKIRFSFVYPDKRGRNVIKEVAYLDANKEGREEHKSLDACHFQPGDFLAVEVWERPSDRRV